MDSARSRKKAIKTDDITIWLARSNSGGEMSEETKPESAAAIRAMAVQEAAKVCEQWQRDYEMDACCDDAQSAALRAVVSSIRALSPAPSVTEEWVKKTVKQSLASGAEAVTPEDDCENAVRATLAALGVKVKP